MAKKLILLILPLLPLLAWAQNREVEIKLKDSKTGEPIAGATVFFDEKYTISDESGRVVLSGVKDERVELSISHVGYKAQEVSFSPDEITKNPVIELKSSLFLLEEVLVSSDQRPLVSQQRFERGEVLKNDPKNIGDIFKDKAGFGLIKRGGYAIDPVFRSFKYDQLNLIYDGGIFISNACPNRMDPASVQVSPAEIDRIELVKGPFSVRYGQTMGALINIITERPTYEGRFEINGELESAYEVNGNGITGRGTLNFVGQKADLSLQGSAINFDNYKNGDGEEVPSAFKNYNYAAKLGINPGKNQRLQLNWRQSFGKDILHASLPMDSPKDNSSIFSIDYGLRNISDVLVSLNAKGYHTFVDHLMTNENRPNFRMVEASSPVTSTTYGGRIELGLQLSPQSFLFVGSDLRMLKKDGERTRIVKMMNGNILDPPRTFTDLIWQDSRLNDAGIFAEANFLINERWEISAGTRIDFVSSGINNPAADFEAIYGSIDTKSEVNFSLTGSVNRYFGRNGLMQVSIGRGQRAASLLERYINHFTVGMDAFEYVGNPDLQSEVNNQIDVTIKNTIGRWSWRGNVFYSFMENYISAVVDEDLPRKYMPGTDPRFAKRFVNLDKAWQTGFDADVRFKMTNALSVHAGGYYTFAQNLDFDEPLPEIPPLTGLAGLRFERSKYWLEVNGRFAASQKRVAASFYESETPGFSVIDLIGAYQPLKNLDVTFALRNVFDVNYYEHLSRPYKNQTENSVLYEPGRSLRFGLRYRF